MPVTAGSTDGRVAVDRRGAAAQRLRQQVADRRHLPAGRACTQPLFLVLGLVALFISLATLASFLKVARRGRSSGAPERRSGGARGAGDDGACRRSCSPRCACSWACCRSCRCGCIRDAVAAALPAAVPAAARAARRAAGGCRSRSTARRSRRLGAARVLVDRRWRCSAWSPTALQRRGRRHGRARSRCGTAARSTTAARCATRRASFYLPFKHAFARDLPAARAGARPRFPPRCAGRFELDALAVPAAGAADGAGRARHVSRSARGGPAGVPAVDRRSARSPWSPGSCWWRPGEERRDGERDEGAVARVVDAVAGRLGAGRARGVAVAAATPSG